jgi:hypothetical protein
VELDQVEPLHSQAAQGAVDGGLDVAGAEPGQRGQVRDVFGVDLDPGDRRRAPTRPQAAQELADQRLDAGVDVGAIEGCDAGLDELPHVLEGCLAVHRAMAAGELPAPLDDAGDRVTGGERGAGLVEGHRRTRRRRGSGTADTSAWRNERFLSRTMRKIAPQRGSGHATSLSVLIQSFGWVGRCFAGSSGSNAASG